MNEKELDILLKSHIKSSAIPMENSNFTEHLMAQLNSENKFELSPEKQLIASFCFLLSAMLLVPLLLAIIILGGTIAVMAIKITMAAFLLVASLIGTSICSQYQHFISAMRDNP